MKSVASALLFCVMFLCGALLGCAQMNPKFPNAVPNNEITVSSTFNVQTVTDANLDELYSACAGKKLDSKLHLRVMADTKDKSSVMVLKNSAQAGYLHISSNLAVCIQETDQGFPVLAAEVFKKSLELVGVPETIVEDWYMQMAKKISQKGRIKVAFRFDNGNAQKATYWVSPNERGWLYYENTFVKANAFTQSDYDFVFMHPNLESVASTVQTANRQGTNRKSFLRQRLDPSTSLGFYPQRATPLPKQQ